MKISFSWRGDGGAREPICQSDLVGHDGIDFLACLLMDGGGRKYESTIAWLDEGLRKVAQVKSRKIDSCDWDRDSWGVELYGETAKIYSLYEDGCFMLLAIDDFEEALLGWRGFLTVE